MPVLTRAVTVWDFSYRGEEATNIAVNLLSLIGIMEQSLSSFVTYSLYNK